MEEVDEGPILPAVPQVIIPAYGKRKGWKPKAQADFGGGGAYPEVSCGVLLLQPRRIADGLPQCHVAQYPLDMGRKKAAPGTTVALQVDADGKVRYDAIAQQGRAPGSKVQSSFKGEFRPLF